MPQAIWQPTYGSPRATSHSKACYTVQQHVRLNSGSAVSQHCQFCSTAGRKTTARQCSSASEHVQLPFLPPSHPLESSSGSCPRQTRYAKFACSSITSSTQCASCQVRTSGARLMPACFAPSSGFAGMSAKWTGIPPHPIQKLWRKREMTTKKLQAATNPKVPMLLRKVTRSPEIFVLVCGAVGRAAGFSASAEARIVKMHVSVRSCRFAFDTFQIRLSEGQQ